MWEAFFTVLAKLCSLLHDQDSRNHAAVRYITPSKLKKSLNSLEFFFRNYPLSSQV